jgi:hypothetical protein
MARMSANNWSDSVRDSAAVGSSSTRTLASSATARAISTICCMPTLSRPIGRLGSMSAPTRASFSRACWFIAVRSSTPNFSGSCPMARFSATVISGMVFSSWWMIATPAEMASRGDVMVTGVPLIMILPASGW